MVLKSLTPMLGVADVHRSIAFYSDTLGLQCLNTFEYEGELCWCVMGAGGPTAGPDRRFQIELMFTRIYPDCVGPHDRDGRKQLYFYFNPDDVVALHASLKSRGYAVSDLRVTVYNMKEFELEDPDGYQLWFGQETDEPVTAR